MCARLAGRGKTPDRVVQLLKEEVGKTSQAATARATGLTLKGVQNYLKGIGEPTQASLQKLADYFRVSVTYLRGGSAIELLGKSIEELPESDDEKLDILTLYTMESVLDFEDGKRKYPQLWEVFEIIPDDQKEEALKFLIGHHNLTIAGRELLHKRNNSKSIK